MGALPLFSVGLNFALARFRLTLKEPCLPFLRHWRRSGSVPPSPRASRKMTGCILLLAGRAGARPLRKYQF